MTNLQDTIEHFRPDYLFLLTCEHNKLDKPDFALLSVQRQNQNVLGKNVTNIEYVELIGIEEAWHETTMMEVYQVLGEIKQKCEDLAGNNRLEYYAGLADGTALITVGISFAAVLYDMQTYFTRGRRSYYNDKYVIQIDNLNEITSTKNWLESHYRAKQNLRYLREIIRLEEQGVKGITAAKIAENVPQVPEAVRNSLRILESKKLIHTEGKRNKVVHSTDLGKLTIKLNPLDLEKNLK